MFSAPAPLWLISGYSPGQDRRVGLYIVLFSEYRVLFCLSAVVVVAVGFSGVFICLFVLIGSDSVARADLEFFV